MKVLLGFAPMLFLEGWEGAHLRLRQPSPGQRREKKDYCDDDHQSYRDWGEHEMRIGSDNEHGYVA